MSGRGREGVNHRTEGGEPPHSSRLSAPVSRRAVLRITSFLHVCFSLWASHSARPSPELECQNGALKKYTYDRALGAACRASCLASALQVAVTMGQRRPQEGSGIGLCFHCIPKLCKQGAHLPTRLCFAPQAHHTHSHDVLMLSPQHPASPLWACLQIPSWSGPYSHERQFTGSSPMPDISLAIDKNVNEG